MAEAISQPEVDVAAPEAEALALPSLELSIETHPRITRRGRDVSPRASDIVGVVGRG